MAAGTTSFAGVASIPKLQGKTNYEEWRNAVQGFCEINGLWRYMLGEITKPEPLPAPADGKQLDATLKEANEAKILKWLTSTDSLRDIIRSTCKIEPMSHVSGMALCSDMWAKFESLYRDTGFIERDAIFIRLSSQTASDFNNVAQFASSLKRDCTRLKEIGTNDVPDWMFTTWLLHGLDSEYDSFRMMLNNSRKAEEAKGTKSEPGFDFVLELILNLDTQRNSTEARSMKNHSKPKHKKKDRGDLCPYCSRPGHVEEKCYYKHPERASQNFGERFKDRIKELQAQSEGHRW